MNRNKASDRSNRVHAKGTRSVRNPKGMRIRAALRAAAGLLLFILLLRSDWLPLWVYGPLLGASTLLMLCDLYSDYRRRRPRRRWRDAGLMLLCLSLVSGVFVPAVIFTEAPDDKATAFALLGLGAVLLAACVYCLWRWRRLRSEAELQLWQLRTHRRKHAASRRVEANIEIMRP
ncbi:hypothetical protein [uncultured Alistipes sp.]|jgi:uncharacterized membrane protein HdeD (DUF308 family)|uniref:hypothetical protein n=1 Tax=uncultured Alistipes sp. TaxID=538949 RepID=UPI0025E327D4|nr:hypothetical protein [uncultured Alistipes sp.]